MGAKKNLEEETRESATKIHSREKALTAVGTPPPPPLLSQLFVLAHFLVPIRGSVRTTHPQLRGSFAITSDLFAI